MGDLEHALVAHITQNGPIGFDEFQEIALYAPALGFYQRGGGAGRRRDFLTSAEVGPLFGAVVAQALDHWWDDAGQPDPFHVVELGAGPGTLARSIVAALPRCKEALRLVLVEVGEAQCINHPDGVTSQAQLPVAGALGSQPVVVFANELLDNLPVAIVELTPDGWAEVTVDVSEGALVESSRPLELAKQTWCTQQAPLAEIGARIPVQADSAAMLAQATALAAGGRVVFIDYVRTTAEMASLPTGQWLRTYAHHGNAGDPLAQPGSCDITCDVALDQLALVARPTEVRTQAEFLRAHGIDRLVAAGREDWQNLGGLAGGLDAIAGRSRVSEAEALLDPAGLGGFTVMEWAG